jgi:hypothetical protein
MPFREACVRAVGVCFRNDLGDLSESGNGDVIGGRPAFK